MSEFTRLAWVLHLWYSYYTATVLRLLQYYYCRVAQAHKSWQTRCKDFKLILDQEASDAAIALKKKAQVILAEILFTESILMSLSHRAGAVATINVQVQNLEKLGLCEEDLHLPVIRFANLIVSGKDVRNH